MDYKAPSGPKHLFGGIDNGWVKLLMFVLVAAIFYYGARKHQKTKERLRDEVK